MQRGDVLMVVNFGDARPIELAVDDGLRAGVPHAEPARRSPTGRCSLPPHAGRAARSGPADARLESAHGPRRAVIARADRACCCSRRWPPAGRTAGARRPRSLPGTQPSTTATVTASPSPSTSPSTVRPSAAPSAAARPAAGRCSARLRRPGWAPGCCRWRPNGLGEVRPTPPRAGPAPVHAARPAAGAARDRASPSQVDHARHRPRDRPVDLEAGLPGRGDRPVLGAADVLGLRQTPAHRRAAGEPVGRRRPGAGLRAALRRPLPDRGDADHPRSTSSTPHPPATATTPAPSTAGRRSAPRRTRQHAYGLAVDVEPVPEPLPSRATWCCPELASSYLDRGCVRPGMITPDGPVVRAFDEIGWTWGGTWQLAQGPPALQPERPVTAHPRRQPV